LPVPVFFERASPDGVSGISVRIFSLTIRKFRLQKKDLTLNLLSVLLRHPPERMCT
jgi:hypothetical protein